MKPTRWQLAHGRSIALDRPRIMAILNVTPDSFYDASRTQDIAQALEAAQIAFESGADMLDIGGESTRPGADRIDEADQIARILPVIEAIRSVSGALAQIPISVDTTLPGVAQAAIEAGADAVNDVSGGTEHPDMLDLTARKKAGLVLMHRLKPPGQDSYSDQYEHEPLYDDVVAQVKAFLHSRADVATDAGVTPDRIVIDPGLGFGKTVDQNLELLRGTPELASMGFPVLSAASRKSFVGRVCGQGDVAPSERLPGSIAFSVAHWLLGATIFRVHDPREQSQALRSAYAIAPEGLLGKPSHEAKPA